MFTKFIALLLTIVVVYCLMDTCAADELERQTMDTLESASKVICVTSGLDPDRASIVRQCEASVPSLYKNTYSTCVRQTLNIRQMTLPFICYRYMEGGQKVKDCLDNRRRIAANLGLNVNSMRVRILNNYAACVRPLLMM
ncbi:uncharacterized protein LOC128956695 [Oppia nitens]|uniref:uncharacterized protein LOC128956695 n=1 Tax=Oppia nitens TaxID=1686743 RepID=UPI0023D97ED0|nr:uncharacterized protein LOC128956695 [Oppia nitens]